MENIGLKSIKSKIVHLSFFLIIGVVFISSLVFAYSPYYTHPDLTEEIAKLWNLKNNEQKLKISQNEIGWMREGAIDEDTPARWINHFYDPIHNVGWQGKHFGTLNQEEGLYQGESMSPKKAIASIDWATNQEYQATYGRQYGNQTWQKAIKSYIDNDKKSAFIALGHILHLIEDASVPDHTRNDTHADLYGDTASPYEEYTKNYTNFNKLTIAESLKNKTFQNFPTIQDAFNYIANYSNNNFFSKDTISNEEFSSPDLKRLIKKTSYLYNDNNLPLASYEIKNGKTKYSINDSTIILPSYFTHLAPQAVSTGASVLNLFFQEVEKYKKNPELLPNIIENSNEVFLSYLQKSPRLMAVNIGNIADRTSTDSQILLAKVSNAVVTAYDTTVNFINRSVSAEDSPNNNRASVLLATTQDTQKPALITPRNEVIKEVINDDTKPSLQTQQNIANADSLPVQMLTKGNPAFGTPTTKDLVVGVPNAVSYGGGGGASPQIQQETTQPITTSSDTTAPVITINPYITTPTNTSITVTATTTKGTLNETSHLFDTNSSFDFVAIDTAGNIATSTVTITNINRISPTIAILGNNPASIISGEVYIDSGATALDDIDGAREVTATSTVNTLIAGVYSVIYTATDLSGNNATSTRVINIIEADPIVNYLFSDLNNNGIADSDESVILIDANRTLPAGAYRFNNLIIASSSILTLEGDRASADIFKGVRISAVNLTINAGSSISADAKGYDSSGFGYGTPSANIYSAGSSYGGVGFGNTATSTYGSATKPIDFGSGGGQCCSAWSAGGGAIQIFLTGTLTNDGIVSSGGSTSSSGGSIYVKTNILTGTGTFRANGGSSYLGNVQYGPGGGGRIALYSQQSSFLGKAEAKGGCVSFDGNSMSCAENGTVGFFDTTNNDLLINTSFRFQKSDNLFNFNHITIAGGAVSVEDGATITASEILVDKGSSFALLGNASLSIPTVILDGGSTLNMSGNETLNINTLTVKGNSNITVDQGQILSLSVANLTIDSSSYISASEKGYGYGAGPGAPSSDSQNATYYAGASYGGVGAGNTETSIYGSVTEPTDFGSGGNGRNPYGGGAIRIVVTDNFIHNGNIYANGSNTSSGGSIFVTTNKIEGNGSFHADGGGGYYPYPVYFWPGGGGRIAIYYQSSTFTGLYYAPGGGCLGCSGGVGGSGSTLMTQISSGITNGNTSTTTSDTLAPIITSMSLSFSTSTGYAKIGDIITLTISADDAGYTLGATTINGVAVAGFTDVGAGAYTAIYTVVSGDNDRVSGSIPASVILVDSAGNASVPFTTVDSNTLKLDANIPVLLSALVISTTTVDVLFSEDLNGSTITNKDFSITGHTLAVPDDTLAIKDAFEVSAGLVRLTVDVPFAVGETPEIIYNTIESNGVKDLAGNTALAGSVLASSGVW